MGALDKNTFGVFDAKSKKLTRFEKYEDAYVLYLEKLGESVKHSFKIPPDLYLVIIQGDDIVQFEQLQREVHCHPGLPIGEINNFEKPLSW